MTKTKSVNVESVGRGGFRTERNPIVSNQKTTVNYCIEIYKHSSSQTQTNDLISKK